MDGRPNRGNFDCVFNFLRRNLDLKRACIFYLTILFFVRVFIQVILVNSLVMQMRFKQK